MNKTQRAEDALHWEHLTEAQVMSYLEELDLDEEGLTEEEIKKRKTKIFVGGLKYSSKDDVLKEYFSQFGEIEEAVVIYDRESGLSKGYGFVSIIHQIHSSLSSTCLVNFIPFSLAFILLQIWNILMYQFSNSPIYSWLQARTSAYINFSNCNSQLSMFSAHIST